MKHYLKENGFKIVLTIGAVVAYHGRIPLGTASGIGN